MAYTLEQLNAATTDEAVAMLDGLYEHSPWIARQALASRPFRSLPQLQDALRRVLDEADAEAGLARSAPTRSWPAAPCRTTA